MDKLCNIKYVLILTAFVIALASLAISNFLISDLEQQERQNMEVWAEAMRSLDTADENTDLNLVLKVINGNNTIPVIISDNTGSVLSWRNINKTFSTGEDSLAYVSRLAEQYRSHGKVIRLEMPDGETYTDILYDESVMLKRLAGYPYVQLCIVVIFVLVALIAVFSTMKAEQDKVWVGLSKETAHQLGTPISSLMAWNTVLREVYPDDEMLPEMERDIRRLERIAERFSKIGSIPEPKPEDIAEVLTRVVEYMDSRTSSKVSIVPHFRDETLVVNLVSSLFEWVIENLCKNAVDAMSGQGRIDIYLHDSKDIIAIEVTDTGKGIPKSQFNNVFTPGFTTKKRGWGLGLSLARRIVEEYHRGKIYVKSSEVGVGTTFRIEIPRT